MRGRHVLMETLVGHGVEYLFGNPGTTESPIIESLQDYPQIRYVLALHEAVAIGAASYYAQASGRTGVVNLHVAPGLGNALGMLYNASKAGSPLLLTAGQQDTRLRLRAPLLGHDLVAMAAPLVKWSAQVERADEMAPLLRRALKIAQDPPSGPVFVALPIDVLEQETAEIPLPPGTLYLEAGPDPAGVTAMAEVLLGSRHPVIVAGDDVGRRGAHGDLLALAEQLGAAVWFEGLRQHVVFPTMHPNCRGALGFDAAAIRKALDGSDAVLLLGGPFFEEVWFAPGSAFPPDAAVLQIEDSPERLSRNFPLRAGLLASPGPALRALCSRHQARGRRGLPRGRRGEEHRVRLAQGAGDGRHPRARGQALGRRADLHPALHGRPRGRRCPPMPSSWMSRSPRASIWAARSPSSGRATTSARAAAASARPCPARSA